MDYERKYEGSFPYQHAAERLGVPYAWMLNASDVFDKQQPTEVTGARWFVTAYMVWQQEQRRRKAL